MVGTSCSSNQPCNLHETFRVRGSNLFIIKGVCANVWVVGAWGRWGACCRRVVREEQSGGCVDILLYYQRVHVIRSKGCLAFMKIYSEVTTL